MKKEKRLIPLKTLKKYYSFLRGCNTRRFRFGNERFCSICHEDCDDPEETHTTSCNHTFHSGCINEWFRPNRMTCPNCRTRQTDVPTRNNPVIVPQRTNRRLLPAFDEVYTPPSRYGSLGLVPRTPRRSNALTPQELEQFDNTGSIGGQAMEYPYDPFDSP